MIGKTFLSECLKRNEPTALGTTEKNDMFSNSLEFGKLLYPSLPVIPAQVWSFGYVFGVQSYLFKM